MWSERIERHAAKMRLRNAEYLRELLEEHLTNEGQHLNDAELRWCRRQWWNERLRDSLIATGRDPEKYAC